MGQQKCKKKERKNVKQVSLAHNQCRFKFLSQGKLCTSLSGGTLGKNLCLQLAAVNEYMVPLFVKFPWDTLAFYSKGA